MVTQKPSKAQQKVLDAMAAGATLEYDRVANCYFWRGGGRLRVPTERTRRVLFARKWIKAISHTSRETVYGLNSDKQ